MDEVKTIPIYYGKCPARGDFLKSRGQYELIQLIDHWISEALEYARQKSEFKQTYTQLPTLDFLIVNPQDKLFLVANLIASEDSSGRRFPMVLGHLIEYEKPFKNILYSPLRYKSMLPELYQLNITIRLIRDANNLLDKLNQFSSQIVVSRPQEAQLFYENHTIHSFAKLMNFNAFQLAQSMLGLGLLLQPVIQNGTSRLNKVLILPIHNPTYCYEIADFWINLIYQFVQHHHTKLFISILHKKQPILLFSFKGTDIRALSDILTDNLNSEYWVPLIDAIWINQYLENNAGLAVLEQSLSERQMSLIQGIELFKQTFIEA
ncbi:MULTISPECIES: type VI secretion system-associated protein TagF [unclassified Acinetobacter]|uniref:type VI secretion system-associated protein TagF n=1 Tax=unclassified Acinetobacter TaxID=196816 RepID=UPI001C2354E2|nr:MULTISPECIES: type VI secretion system-associated protein TagF [unclassified Acinetobacter]